MYKTCMSSMIPSAKPTVQPATITILTWNLIWFWKVRTDGFTQTTCENSDHYRPWLWIAESIIEKFTQELLALSSALSATLTAQIGFDARQLKHCSTYNLAEGIAPGRAGGGRAIYRLASDEYELAVTPKKSNYCLNIFGCLCICISKFRKHLEVFVDHNVCQRFILFCILINTFSMGIEYHLQVG